MFRLYARSWGCGVNGDFLVRTWLVQPALNTVSLKGNAVRLEPKVMDVLVCLASRYGEPVSKQELLNTVWTDAFVSEDVLARSISELRPTFDDNPRQLKRFHGEGILFSSPHNARVRGFRRVKDWLEVEKLFLG